MLKWRVDLTLCKLLCFVRVHGVKGLERWITRKFSVSYAWRARATRRKTHGEKRGSSTAKADEDVGSSVGRAIAMGGVRRYAR